MCVEPVSEPVSPCASQTPLAVLAAVRQALILAEASAPEKRSAICTPLSEFTAAAPLTSRLNCGFVVFTPSDVGVKRWNACRWLKSTPFPTELKFEPVSVTVVAVAPETKIPICCPMVVGMLLRNTQKPVSDCGAAGGRLQAIVT